MTDTIDKVNEQAAELLERQLSKQRNAPIEAVHAIDGKHYCIDCDNQIRPERVAVAPNAPRCIYCQTDFEKERKHFA